MGRGPSPNFNRKVRRPMRAHRKRVRSEKLRQNQRVVAKLVKSADDGTSTVEIPTTVRHQPKLIGLQRTLPLGKSKKSLKRKERSARALDRIREEIAEMRESNKNLQSAKSDNAGDVKMAPSQTHRRKSVSSSATCMQEE